MAGGFGVRVGTPVLRSGRGCAPGRGSGCAPGGTYGFGAEGGLLVTGGRLEVGGPPPAPGGTAGKGIVCLPPAGTGGPASIPGPGSAGCLPGISGRGMFWRAAFGTMSNSEGSPVEERKKIRFRLKGKRLGLDLRHMVSLTGTLL